MNSKSLKYRKNILPTMGVILIAAISLIVLQFSCAKKPKDKFNPGDFPGPTESFKDYNETIMQFDLGKEINLKGRVMRMHYSTMAPGGMILQHSHANRPTTEYVVEGNTAETKKDGTGKVVVEHLNANQNELSTVGITHWWKNESKGMVKLMAIDIWVDSVTVVCRPQGKPRPLTEPLIAPPNPDNIKIENLGKIDLEQQFPEIIEAKDYIMRSRRLTILPLQKTKLENSKGRPGITFILKGDVWENRSDEKSSIRREGEFSALNNGVSYYWENPTTETVVLWVVDIVKKGEQ